jgi:hypothetical protein
MHLGLLYVDSWHVRVGRIKKFSYSDSTLRTLRLSRLMQQINPLDREENYSKLKRKFPEEPEAYTQICSNGARNRYMA